MISTVLRELPPFVKLEEQTFQLVIIIDEDKKATLSYILTDGKYWPYWYNIFEQLKKTKHLIKYENITSEMSLRQGIYPFKKFLHALQSK